MGDNAKVSNGSIVNLHERLQQKPRRLGATSDNS